MRHARLCSQIADQLAQYLPNLSTAQRYGLALWSSGTVLAKSGCQSAVSLALLTAFAGAKHLDAIRQALREWLRDGADKAAPCKAQVALRACCPNLLRWVLSWWQGRDLALAVDATLLHARVSVLCISLLYSGNAIPLAWKVLPANHQGAWMPEIVSLLDCLAPAMAPKMRVVVMADRGLWSPRLWRSIRGHGWHPLLRLQLGTTFAPAGAKRQAVRSLVAAPGAAWVGRGCAFKDKQRQLSGTLLVVWAAGQKEPWVLLTDLRQHRLGLGWYAARMWIELGFRSLKSIGWQWQKTKRRQPGRVERHLLVLAVATLWVLSYGTRAEQAAARGVAAASIRWPQQKLGRVGRKRRRVSIFARGQELLGQLFAQGKLWHRLWLSPDPLPRPPADLTICYYSPP